MKENKGITLIALVITIIVLLILAGVAIAMLSGENGILKKATEAKTKTEEGQKQEETTLSDMEITTDFITNNIKYKIKNGYMTGFKVGDKVEDVEKELKKIGYEINLKYDYNKKKDIAIENKANENIATGMSVQENGKTVARTILFGDVTGSQGEINVDDYMYCLQIVTTNIKPEEYQLVAADVDHNGIINQKDVDMINQASVNTVEISQDYYASEIKNLLSETNNNIKNKYLEIYKEKLKNSTYSIEYDSEYDEYILRGTTNEIKVGDILNLLGDNENTIITDEKKKEKTIDQNLEPDDMIMHKSSDGRNVFICYAL